VGVTGNDVANRSCPWDRVLQMIHVLEGLSRTLKKSSNSKRQVFEAAKEPEKASLVIKEERHPTLLWPRYSNNL